MNYCTPYLDNLPSPLNSSETYIVTQYISSNQQISNGFAVRYKAGTYVELKDGFVSGTDFVAEIDPCIITRTTIAAKTDDIYNEPELNENIAAIGGIKIYPTVIASGNSLTIEVSEGLENGSVTLYDIQAKAVQYIDIPQLHGNEKYSFSIGYLPSGLYFVKVKSNKIFETQKIIIQ